MAAVSGASLGYSVVKEILSTIISLKDEVGHHKNTAARIEQVKLRADRLRIRLDRLSEHDGDLPEICVDDFVDTISRISECLRTVLESKRGEFYGHEVKNDFVQYIENLFATAECELCKAEDAIKRRNRPVVVGGSGTPPRQVTNLRLGSELEALTVKWKDEHTSDNIVSYEIELQYLSMCHHEIILRNFCLKPNTNEFQVRFYELDSWMNYSVRVRAICKGGVRGVWCKPKTHFLKGKPAKPEFLSYDIPSKKKIRVRFRCPDLHTQEAIKDCRLQGYNKSTHEPFLKEERLTHEVNEKNQENYCDFEFSGLQPLHHQHDFCLQLYVCNSVAWSQPTDYFQTEAVAKLHPDKVSDVKRSVQENDKTCTFYWESPRTNYGVIESYILQVFYNVKKNEWQEFFRGHITEGTKVKVDLSRQVNKERSYKYRLITRTIGEPAGSRDLVLEKEFELKWEFKDLV